MDSLKKHYEWKGKIETRTRAPLTNRDELALAYTPGVAEACLVIKNNPEESFLLTRRWNTVAVITDGTAVLGLGDIGALAGMPVMEGKCAIMREFAGIDALPICVNTRDNEEFINAVRLISMSFGAINLEDIAAPRCFEIEKRLQNLCDIPVFHDDQHGTAVVVAAAVINAMKLARKTLPDARIVINGAGAAGIAIAAFLLELGVRDLVLCDRAGILESGLNPAQAAISSRSNPRRLSGALADAMRGADCFIGVSAGGVVSCDMVRSMAERAVCFPLANPVPEISYDEAISSGAFIAGTGSSQFPNQINNALAFPGIFRGALDARAQAVTTDMMKAAAFAIASFKAPVPNSVIPDLFDKSLHSAVAFAVRTAALK